MPRVKPENRRRAKTPKTRSGCKTCKIRRVKCDEAKPSCQRCVSTGRECDGYDGAYLSPDESSFGGPIGPLSSVFKSEKEHRSFSFFLERTSHQLSGYYECDFWNRVILQAAQVDPGIRCSVIALGSLHEDFEKFGEAETGRDDFALQQYNLAICQHLDSLSSPAKDPTKIDNYVASCMIFMCIELIQGHYLSALSLMKGAVRLFYERTLDPRMASAWPVKTFEMILSRLQSQALGLLEPSIVGLTVPPRISPASNIWIPKRFKSVSEAKSYLEFYSHSHTLSLSAAAYQPAHHEALNFDLYRDVLSHWTSAFERLLTASGENMTARDSRVANTLKIWTLMMENGISMSLDHSQDYDDQELWDLYMHNCEEVVRLAESVVKHAEIPDHGQEVTTHQFTLDFGVVGPLYDTARICRDPIIRRKAIYLLRAYPRREGLWDSLLAARSAERQMELEEAAVPEVRVAADIPGWGRISSAVPTFQPGQRWASVVYTRQQPVDGSEPESFHEVIEW